MKIKQLKIKYIMKILKNTFNKLVPFLYTNTPLCLHIYIYKLNKY